MWVSPFLFSMPHFSVKNEVITEFLSPRAFKTWKPWLTQIFKIWTYTTIILSPCFFFPVFSTAKRDDFDRHLRHTTSSYDYLFILMYPRTHWPPAAAPTPYLFADTMVLLKSVRCNRTASRIERTWKNKIPFDSRGPSTLAAGPIPFDSPLSFPFFLLFL